MMVSKDELCKRALKFLDLYFFEYGEDESAQKESRIQRVVGDINRFGVYEHTPNELIFGAKVAWRNSNRCVGRLSWDTLEVFDNRHLTTPDEIMTATVNYVKWAENGGKIRPAICVFAPRNPVTGAEIRFWNSKLVRYAGYQKKDSIVGDPDEVGRTMAFQRLGWNGAGGRFDLQPIVLDVPGYPKAWYEWKDWHNPIQVPIVHPEYSWFSELNLRWYGVPIIADMTLEIGGIEYTAAPFNGWFMGTEIGTRNLADEHRYNMLPVIANRMGLEIKKPFSLWRDRALTELNTAVLYSYRIAGVTITDHHTAAAQFQRFERREEQASREVCADWTWIVPPTAGSTTALFHKTWSNEVKSPNYYYRNPAFESKTSREEAIPGSCPFHIQHRRNQNN